MQPAAELKAGCCFAPVSFNIFLTSSVRHLPHLPDRSSPSFFNVGRTTAVDDQYETSFSIPQGTFQRQPIIVGCIHTFEFR